MCARAAAEQIKFQSKEQKIEGENCRANQKPNAPAK